ncbi:MAG TPA: formyl-CoA transferase [Rhodospirillaceae bacterium]|nr:formyl-CoA transferase [Rhodospirillaceae bacterium]
MADPLSAAAAGNDLPMSDLVALDLMRARAGPTCVRMLADWGAHVIKVEATAKADPRIRGQNTQRRQPDFFNLHRNKRSVTLDLKKPEGHKIFMQMVEKADVIVENFRADVKNRLRINYDDCAKVNPRIIYGSISGFGQDGPYSPRPGVDQIAQGMGGLMSITGLPGQGPVRVGIPICDLTAGMYLAIGVLSALHERHRTGKGRWVHTSLLEAMIGMLDYQVARWTMVEDLPPQVGNDHPINVPTSLFPTKDGHVNLAAGGDHMFARFCKALECEELLEVPEFKSNDLRFQNRDAVNEAVSKATSKFTTAECVEKLNEIGVPCGPQYDIAEMLEDEQVKHLGVTWKVNHPDLGETEINGNAINIEGHEKSARMPTPEYGEYNEAVLESLGYDEAAIDELRKSEVIV